MNFGKYIHTLLLENEVVIIPGFGAFISTYQPAEIVEDSDEIKPPSKMISFNPQIRNNDGLLVGYVAEKQRISHFDALKKIEKEREEILYKLDSGEKVEISEVGVLFHNEDGSIGFNARFEENMLLDSFGLETTIINEEKEQEESVKSESVIVVENSAHDEKYEPEEELVADSSGEEKFEESKVLILEEAEADNVVDKEKVITTPSGIDAQEYDEKKKKRGWLLLLVLVPLIGISVFVFLRGFDHGKSDKNRIENDIVVQPEEPEKELVQNSVLKDSVGTNAVDTTIVIDSVATPEIQTEEIQNDNGPKYYLVGGSFSVKENADNYLNELKSKGFDAFHVGMKGRFYIVGIGTYNSFAEAEKAKVQYLEQNSGSEVWVYRK